MECWQKKFIRMIFPYSAKRLRIEEAFRIKHPHVPKKLYKYRSFSELHLQALREGVLWMSAPERFNDPYDTSIYFNTDGFLIEDIPVEESIAEARQLQHDKAPARRWEPKDIKNPISQKEWQEKLQTELLGDQPQNVRNALSAALKELQEKTNLEMVEKFTDHLRSGCAVLSLAESPLSSVMWSHYSDSHRGFCVEYDFGNLAFDDLRRRLCFPVFYRRKLTDSTRYLAWKGRDNFNNLFGQLLCLLKSDEWAYEQEWRIVHMIGPAHANMSLTMPKPTAVILGCQVRSEDRTKMSEICDNLGIAVLETKQKRDQFRLEVKGFQHA